MMKSKTWRCGWLAAVLVAAEISIPALAAFQTVNGVNWGYSTTNGEARVFSAKPATGALIIPSSLGGYPVTAINPKAFTNCTGLTSVTIPESVTSIGDNAFEHCTNLTRVAILGNITNSWEYFYYSPSAYKYNSPFLGCDSLTTVDLGEKMQSIGDSMFVGVGLTNVSIPDSVMNIGYQAFYNCRRLTNVTIGNSVTNIGGCAFSNCWSLSRVTIPDSVARIGRGAFAACRGLTSVTIPESVTDLSPTAFDGCDKLWPSWYRTLANLSANGGSSGGGSSGPVAQTVALTVTNVIVHYVTPGLPSGAVTPDTGSAGIVNIVAEVTADKAVAISPEWADQYPAFAATFGTDFSAALTKPTGKRDSAGNPMYVWQDYVAGTDPTDPTSVFTASVTFDAETGAPVIGWSPELTPAEAAKRLYTTYGKVRLTDPDWLPVADDPSPYNFFRLTVEMK